MLRNYLQSVGILISLICTVKELPVKIQLIRGTAGKPERVKKILKALGFKRVNQTLVVKDNESVLGMVNKVRHMIVEL